MGPLVAVTAIVIFFALLVTFIAWTDGLTLLAPKSMSGVRASAEFYCVDECRVGGRCRLTDAAEPADHCPLKRFVEGNWPTMVRGRPQERPFEAAAA